MSAEDIKQKIDIENPFERSLELRNRIFTAKLSFLEKQIAEGKYPESEYVKAVTSQMGAVDYLVDRYRALEKKEHPEITPAELEKFSEDKKQEIVKEVTELSLNSNGEKRVHAISSYVRQHTDRLPLLEDDRKLEAVGLIGLKHIKGNEYQAVEGIKKSDDILELHFEDAFMTGSQPKAEQIKMWFSKIAEMIIDKYPETTAIAGKSWMMSDEEIVSLLDAACESFDNPMTPKSIALDDFNFFRSSLGFLKSVGRLPKKYSSESGIIS